MSPIRLIIPGDHWDSQLYRGRLYLTSMNGDTSVYDWDLAVEQIIRNASERLTITCAFSRGDYLYHPEWALVFADPDVGSVLQEKFASLAKTPIEMPLSVLADSLLGSCEALGGLADDTAMYKNHIYAATQSGLVRADVRKTRTKRNRSGVGPAERIWDAPSLALAVRRGGDLAIAAGSDGLFELSGLFADSLSEPRLVSSRHTLFAGYAYASIYGSSDRAGCYMAAYAWRKEGPDAGLVRQFVRTFKDSDIFKHARGMSWANQEKIYLCAKDTLFTARYVQSEVEDEDEGPFHSLRPLPVPMVDREVLGGGVSFFGTVIEHDGGLVVVQSDGKIHEIPGPVTRWRVFPRSNRYENQLHVVLEDRLEIYSFNHDYVVQQGEKIAGIEYRSDFSHKPSGPRTVIRA